MTDHQAKQMLDKIVGQVFGYKNPFSLEEFAQKYAFDVRLPSQVTDATTGEPTWVQSINPTKFIKFENVPKQEWTPATKKPESLEDILKAWDQINLVATERQIDSTNVSQSDNVYASENVYRSLDTIRSKNILFSDGATDCEYVAMSQRSNTSTYCLRLEDSKECSGSFSVSWSGKIVNSFFIHDCFDMYESMFCSHIFSKRFCIANMQFEEAEYRKLKDMVIRWILGN